MCSVGDIGTRIDVTLKDEDTDVVVDISTATTMEYILKTPSNQRLIRSASFVTNGTNGQLRYTTIAGDFTEYGIWTLQAKVIYVAGTFLSKSSTFVVENAL